MKIKGHLAGGWLVTKTIVNNLKIAERKERKNLLALGSFFGILPDLDFIPYVIKKRKVVYENDFRHHTWITHTFPFYLLPALLVFLTGKKKGNRKMENAAKVFAASTSTHLFQDMIGSGDGIMLFYPFSKKMVGIGKSDLHGPDWENHYTNSPYYFVEILITIFAFSSFLSELLKKKDLG